MWQDVPHVSPISEHFISRKDAGLNAESSEIKDQFASALELMQTFVSEEGIQDLEFRVVKGSHFSWFPRDSRDKSMSPATQPSQLSQTSLSITSAVVAEEENVSPSSCSSKPLAVGTIVTVASRTWPGTMTSLLFNATLSTPFVALKRFTR